MVLECLVYLTQTGKEQDEQQELSAWRARAENRRAFRDRWIELAGGNVGVDVRNILVLAAEVFCDDRPGKVPVHYIVCSDSREIVSYEPHLLGLGGIVSEDQYDWVTVHLHWQRNKVERVTVDISAGGEFTNYAKHKGRYGNVPDKYRFCFFTDSGTNRIACQLLDGKRVENLTGEKAQVATKFLAECADRIGQVERGEYFPTYTRPAGPWAPTYNSGSLQ